MGYFFVNYVIINNDLFKTLRKSLSDEQKYLIKKYIFPYQLISDHEDTIAYRERTIDKMRNFMLSVNLHEAELNYKKSLRNINTKKNSFNLANDIVLDKYTLTRGIFSGIARYYPGSGYIDFFEDNLFILSARGIIGYTNELNNEDFNIKQIKNNINDFIGLEAFNKDNWFSFKDLLIHDNKIFVSYTEEMKKDCWNTGVIVGKVNFENIEFEKFFSPNNCNIGLEHENFSQESVDGEFNALQSGGKMFSFDDNHILLSTGEYRTRSNAQNEKSINGKILKININNSNFEIISMGHRNPQGLYFDKENNIIIETEHGPMGGDEINLIDLDQINKDKIFNYGWPIVSAGEHYGGKIERNEKKYAKYPLYKSHTEHGFIEPLKSFVPSIGISDVSKIGKNKYVVSSLKAKSLYFFELNDKKQIENLQRVSGLGDRVRDLDFANNKLYLFLENTPSIGVISFN